MKGAAVFLLLLLNGAGPGPSPHQASPTPMVRVSGAFFALSVADLGASTEWYSSKLGLRVVLQSPRANGAAVTVLEGDGLMVELIQHENAVPRPKAVPDLTDPMLLHGFVKAGFVVEAFDQVAALLRAQRAEIAFGPYPARSGQRANLIVKDNAGNLIQIFGK
ncbi:MAG: VOC family protein [Gemmatimonadota bacterium]